MLVKITLNALMALLFGLAAIMLVPAALGFHRYVILTGSMTGTYDAGSIVFDRPIPTSSLRVGDPITYAPPPGASPNHKLVTHRLYRITTAPGGKRVFQTKGDANPRPDAWKFLLPQATQDTVRFHVPYVGFAFQLLSVPSFRKAVIGVPALLLALWTVVGMWKEGGEAKRRREEAIAPWSADVRRALPQLAPLGDGDPAAGRGVVRLPVTWPAPAPSRRRGPLPTAAAPPLPTKTPNRGRVRLPAACVPTARRRGPGPRAHHLPAGWRLVVRASRVRGVDPMRRDGLG